MDLNVLALMTLVSAPPQPTDAVVISGVSTTVQNPITGSLSYSDLKYLMKAAGFPESEFTIGAAIATAESGRRPGINNAGTNSNGTIDYGLWQINSVHADLLTGHDPYDPAQNAAMAYVIWKAAGGWTPWSTYNNGAYEAFMAAAGGSPVGTSAPVISGIPTEGLVQTLTATLVSSEIDYW